MIPRRPMLLWPWSAAWITALLLASTAAAGIAAEPAGPKTPARLEESPQRKQMADGLPPLEAAEAMSAPAGFSVKLLAAEPDVRQPIAFCFDDRGRLWVAECYAYPKKVPADQARDRILIFEDTDGDHVLDSRKVFKEGLNLVSGLAVGFGGVWVGAAPDLMFIPDADGDDRPDGEPEILLDGWGAQDTHETLNSFIWGPDGWLYGCHGVFTHSAVGRPGTAAADRTRINAGIWRYHPVRHVFEVFSEGTSNPWGVDFNDLGHAFQTACVIPHLYHVIQGARYQRQAGQHFNPYSFDDIKTIARHRHWKEGAWHATGRNGSEAFGGGHAHAGACIYLGNAWPDRYRGRLFMNNIHGARINEDRLTPSGSGYVGDGEPDFLFANDSWSQFISLQVGPDGQMVLIDWYDRNQCHHRDTETHDRGNGRIFKVLYGDTKSQPVRVDLARESDATLVELLAHDNEWFVRHARRLLQERAAAGRLAADTPQLLRERLASATVAPRRLRMVWALHVIGQLSTPEIERLLDDTDPAVRGWAIQLAAEPRQLTPALLDRLRRLASDDPSPVVRLAICSALQRLPPADRWPIAAALLVHPEDAGDHNLPLMNWYAIEPLVPLDPARALDLAASSQIPTVAKFIVRRAASDEASCEPLIARLAAGDSATRKWMLEEVLIALAARGRMPAPSAWQQGYEQLRGDPDDAVRRLADLTAVRFGDSRIVPQLRMLVANRDVEIAERRKALQTLVSSRDDGLPPVLQRLVSDPAIRKEAIEGLAAFSNDDTPGVLISAYDGLPADCRQAAIASLTSRPAWTLALLDAVEAGDLPRGDLSAFTVGRLAQSADPKVLARLNEVWGTTRATPADRKAEFGKWREALNSNAMKEADLSRGRATYAKTCAACHQLHGEGGRIGPDLTGSNRADLEYLLANLLDPSAVVGRDYQTTIVMTDDGRSIAGIAVKETPTSLTLQTPTEQVTVPLDDIETRTLSPQSLMPENQLAQLAPAAARDLIAYLRHPKQVPLPDDRPPSGEAIDGPVDWPRLRGHAAAGAGGRQRFPRQWGDRDWAWTASLPGVGHASPVVWRQRIYTASADESAGTRFVSCHDTADGRLVWQREIPGPIEPHHAQNSSASGSVTVDETGVYWLWATKEQLRAEAFTHDGKPLWHVDLGPFASEHGFGASAAVYGDRLIVPIEHDGPSAIVALDTKTGRELWRLPRETARTAYSTPLVIDPEGPAKEGKAMVVLASMAHGLTGVDPATGRVVWELKCFPRRTVSSPVMAGPLVLCTCGEGGGDNTLVAVRPATDRPADPGAEGSRPAEPEIAYKLDRSLAPYVPTPVCSGERLYLWGDRGVVTCVKAADGSVIWRGRVGGSFSASPIVAGGTVINVSAEGEVVVIADGDAFEVLGRTPLGEPCRATPAVAGGRMFFRSLGRLHALDASPADRAR